MSLPRLSAPSGGQLLVRTVWDLASRDLEWPTFAILDRELDSRHDLQAEDVLKEMPPGFIYGYGPSSPTTPSDSQEIALTVAGVAECPNTDEVLSIFVELVQMATVIEKGWTPPAGAPEGTGPTITTEDFARNARHLPAAGRTHLLRLVFLIVRGEPSFGWTGRGSSDDGNWTVIFDRRIRTFRGVQTIDEYWSKRHKPWEQQRPMVSAPFPLRTGLPASTREPTTVNNFNGPISATNFAAGDNATQHATITNVSEIRQAVRAVMDACPA